jgi:hypothetical protein
MRSVRLSRTFIEELAGLLEQGLPRFGRLVVDAKRALVVDTINNYLTLYPIRNVDPDLGVCIRPVRKTPFLLLYDYDDAELRVHLIIHEHADRTLIDLSTIEW